MTIRKGYRDTLTANQAHSLAARLTYSIEGIWQCEVDEDRMEIVIEPEEGREEASIAETVEEMLREERGIRSLGSRVVKERPRLIHSPEIWSHEQEDRLAWISPKDGRVRRDSAAGLTALLDRLFLSLAAGRNASLRKYPSMISLDTLDKCGYVRSFPQNLFVVSEFPHDYRTLRRLKESDNPAEHVRTSPYALSPAVCFHCYEELAGKTLRGPTVLTASGSCFRHEAPWRVGNHRMNEFGMREVVFIGEPAFVEEERSWWMNEIWTLFCDLGLGGRLATANDPFYFSEDAFKSQHQKMASMKYELIVDSAQESSFSIASFNNMGDSLCRPFGVLDDSGKPADSGCVAFGLDRWAFALLAEFGPVEEWPAGILDRVRGGTPHPA